MRWFTRKYRVRPTTTTNIPQGNAPSKPSRNMRMEKKPNDPKAPTKPKPPPKRLGLRPKQSEIQKKEIFKIHILNTGPLPYKVSPNKRSQELSRGNSNFTRNHLHRHSSSKNPLRKPSISM